MAFPLLLKQAVWILLDFLYHNLIITVAPLSDCFFFFCWQSVNGWKLASIVQAS